MSPAAGTSRLRAGRRRQWCHDLATRHARLAARARRSPMVLLLGARPAHVRHLTTNVTHRTDHLHPAVHTLVRAEREASARRHFAGTTVVGPSARPVAVTRPAAAILGTRPVMHRSAPGPVAPVVILRAPGSVGAAARAEQPSATAVARTGGHPAPVVAGVARSHRRIELAQPGRPALRLPHTQPVGAGGMPERQRSAAITGGEDDRQAVATSHATAVVDIERLTNEVVARLDDRLTAHRERLGMAG